jgi:DNA-binding LacI/PurR family transcriptional regulator
MSMARQAVGPFGQRRQDGIVVQKARASARPNLEDVAAQAGVSRATVSRVVNGQTTVAPELRERVQRAIDQLGYVPNQAARSLMSRRNDTIALLASESDVRVFGDPFFSGVVRGITQEANRAGLQLVMLMAQTEADLERAKRYLRSDSIDAVMMISEHSVDDPIPPLLERLGIPYVIGGRPLQAGLAAVYVDNDNVFGGALAAQHLASLGRSVIGTVAGPADMSAGIDRLTGFKKGLGRAFRADRVERADFTQAGGEAATERLLERVPDLDGLFAASDLTALGALAALRRAGRRVPDDVALVGFDDNDFAATTDPPLTTVRQSPLLQGRTMVRLYLAQHRPDLVVEPDDLVPDVVGVDHVVLPVHLVVRESA